MSIFNKDDNTGVSNSGPTYTPQVSPAERDTDSVSVISKKDYEHDPASGRQHDKQDGHNKEPGSSDTDVYERRDLTPTYGEDGLAVQDKQDPASSHHSDPAERWATMGEVDDKARTKAEIAAEEHEHDPNTVP